MPAARSQTTSASPMPWIRASSPTRSQSSSASGRSSQRAYSSAPRAPPSDGPTSPCAFNSARSASSCESVSLTDHILQDLLSGKSSCRVKLTGLADGLLALVAVLTAFVVIADPHRLDAVLAN